MKLEEFVDLIRVDPESKRKFLNFTSSLFILFNYVPKPEFRFVDYFPEDEKYIKAGLSPIIVAKYQLGDHFITFSKAALKRNDPYTNLFDIMHELIHYICHEARHHIEPEADVDDKAGLILMKLSIPLGRRAQRLKFIENPQLFERFKN